MESENATAMIVLLKKGIDRAETEIRFPCSTIWSVWHDIQEVSKTLQHLKDRLLVKVLEKKLRILMPNSDVSGLPTAEKKDCRRIWHSSLTDCSLTVQGCLRPLGTDYNALRECGGLASVIPGLSLVELDKGSTFESIRRHPLRINLIEN